MKLKLSLSRGKKYMIWKYSLSTGQEEEFKTLFRHTAEPNNAKIVSIHNFAGPKNAKMFFQISINLYTVFMSIDKNSRNVEGAYIMCPLSISMSIWNC